MTRISKSKRDRHAPRALKRAQTRQPQPSHASCFRSRVSKTRYGGVRASQMYRVPLIHTAVIIVAYCYSRRWGLGAAPWGLVCGLRGLPRMHLDAWGVRGTAEKKDDIFLPQFHLETPGVDLSRLGRRTGREVRAPRTVERTRHTQSGVSRVSHKFARQHARPACRRGIHWPRAVRARLSSPPAAIPAAGRC